MATKVVKVSDENLAAVGASNVAEFDAALTKFLSESKLMSEKIVTLESLQASITTLEGKIVTEARIKELVTEGSSASATSAVSTWAASDAGKKIIGAESSRIAMEALASVGTQPAKPAPVSGGGIETAEQKSAALIAEGKFEEAYALNAKLRAEFPSAKHFAAFARNESAVKISRKN